MAERKQPAGAEKDTDKLLRWLRKFVPWLRDFVEAVKMSPTARSAWIELTNVNLDVSAAITLCSYADREMRDAFRRNAERLARQAKAAVRAIEVAETRRPKRDAALFRSRATDLVTNLVYSEWPIAGAGPLLDTLNSIERQLGAVPPLEWLASRLRKASGARSHLRFFPLLWLREQARVRGVQLGVKRLQALAYCADPKGKREPDSSTLARYFREHTDLVNHVRASISSARRQR